MLYNRVAAGPLAVPDMATAQGSAIPGVDQFWPEIWATTRIDRPQHRNCGWDMQISIQSSVHCAPWLMHPYCSARNRVRLPPSGSVWQRHFDRRFEKPPHAMTWSAETSVQSNLAAAKCSSAPVATAEPHGFPAKLCRRSYPALRCAVRMYPTASPIPGWSRRSKSRTCPRNRFPY
jgi:hypothetical protein